MIYFILIYSLSCSTSVQSVCFLQLFAWRLCLFTMCFIQISVKIPTDMYLCNLYVCVQWLLSLWSFPWSLNLLLCAKESQSASDARWGAACNRSGWNGRKPIINHSWVRSNDTESVSNRTNACVQSLECLVSFQTM